MAWTPYQAPQVNMQTGTSGTQGFFRPADSKAMSGNALYQYLTAGGTPASETNRTVKYDGGLTREMIGNTTGFLSNQIGTGFDSQLTGIENLFNRFGSLGGLGGMQSGSPVYRPGGQTVDQTAQSQGTNGQPLPWAAANPFKATF